jgi:hypothetical protein
MPVNPQDKPLDALREETIDQLVMNYGHGKLSLEAFERRLDQALDAKEHEALVALTQDLDLQVDAGYIEKKKEELGIRYQRADVEDVEHIVHVFSGGERSGDWTVPREVQVFTIFGGTDIDFSDARFSAPRTRVKLLCLFGGVDIYVPEKMRTTVKAFCVFGAITNKAPASDDPNAPQLIVEGLVLFGGADIKIKRTFRERLLQFADGLRSMFGEPTQPRRD